MTPPGVCWDAPLGSAGDLLSVVFGKVMDNDLCLFVSQEAPMFPHPRHGLGPFFFGLFLGNWLLYAVTGAAFFKEGLGIRRLILLHILGYHYGCNQKNHCQSILTDSSHVHIYISSF
jgi:hypothetical protein